MAVWCIEHQGLDRGGRSAAGAFGAYRNLMLTKGKLDPVVAFRDGLCDLKGADKLGGIQMDGVLALELLKNTAGIREFPFHQPGGKEQGAAPEHQAFPSHPHLVNIAVI